MIDMDRCKNLFEYLYLYTLPSLIKLMLRSACRYLIEPGSCGKLANVAVMMLKLKLNCLLL